MKNLIPIFIFALIFVGCAETQEAPKNIDETAERAKNWIDKASTKARDILDNSDGEVDKIKAIVDKIANKSKDVKGIVEKNKDKWKEEVDRITNDPKFKDKIEGIKAEGGDIFKEIEGLVNDIAKDIKDIDKKNP